MDGEEQLERGEDASRNRPPGAYHVAGPSVGPRQAYNSQGGSAIDAASTLQLSAFVAPVDGSGRGGAVYEGTPIGPVRENEEYHHILHRKATLVVFGALLLITVLGVGLGLGLTRTASTQAAGEDYSSGSGEQEVCDYVQSSHGKNQPWHFQETITDPEEIFFLNLHYLDGSMDFVSRSFGSSASLSYDGRRLAIGDRFGDAFYVYERADDTSSPYSLVGLPIPGVQEFVPFTKRDVRELAAVVELAGNGNVVACGMPYYRSLGNDEEEKVVSGAVLVYGYESGSWTQRGDAFVGSSGETMNYLGESISLSEDGTVLALGEPHHLRGTGRVTIHRYDVASQTWALIGDEILGDRYGDGFGSSVSLSRDGTMVASGSLLHDGDNAGTGYARVFRNADNEVWSQVGDTLVAEDDGYASYGWPVSLSGDGTRLAVSSASHGSGGNVEGGLDRGYVRVYDYSNEKDAWSQLGNGVEGSQGGDGLGWSLALSADGTTLAAGASNSDTSGTDQGYARVYRYLCGNWTQVGRDVVGSDVNGWTGASVDMSETGEHLAVGTPFDYAGGIASAGYVRVYESPFR